MVCWAAKLVSKCLILKHLGGVDVEGPSRVGVVAITVLANNQGGVVLDAAAWCRSVIKT